MSQDLGMDRSGNGNNWTVNNITYADQMLDVPKNNYCTLNPLHHDMDNHGNNLNRVYSEGNLKISTDTVAGVSSTFFGTMGVTSGKWYYEAMTIAGGNVGAAIGIANYNGGDNMYYYSNGNKYYDGGSASYGASYANLDVVGVAFNADTNAITFYKNGVSQGEITSAITGGGHYFPAGWDGSGSLFALLVYNFGQDSSFAGNKTAQGKRDSEGIGDFYYNVPSGYKALCTFNLPDVAVIPSEHFNTVLYNGSSSTPLAVTGVGFTPDFVWVKTRSEGWGHGLFSILNGAGDTSNSYKYLFSNSNAAEARLWGEITFDSDGWSGVNSGYNGSFAHDFGAGGQTFVSWNWKANGSGSSNTNGSVTSTVSANVDAGFSIIKYTGESDGTDTVGHGLSKTPEIVFWKSTSKSEDWLVTSTLFANPNRNYIKLNQAAAKGTFASDAYFHTLNTIRAETRLDDADSYIAYAFHSVEGYSKIGSYTGNDKADGTFVYTGFRPAFVMAKNVDEGYSWIIADSAREPNNSMDFEIYPDTAAAEYDSSGQRWDFLSNGIKLRSGSAVTNEDTIIYIAFAETPFKYSNAR
tara:strand:- start:253 stop:1989 length:1737 start_codon:yes stop_codon:yes gene_type:complete